jgi:hypothetical protein
MRASVLLALVLGLTPALPAQIDPGSPATPATAAPASATTQDNAGDSFSSLLLKPDNFSSSGAGEVVPTPNPLNAQPPEKRTAEQLQAILAGYVGHWTGNYVVTSTRGVELSRFPIDVIYVMQKNKDGRLMLTGTTSFDKKGVKTTETVTSWVEDGQILAEINHDGITELFFARTRGADLVWFTHDLKKGVTDFSMTESLRLTADGGTLNSKGFEAVPGATPPTIVSVTSSLVKQPK